MSAKSSSLLFRYYYGTKGLSTKGRAFLLYKTLRKAQPLYFASFHFMSYNYSRYIGITLLIASLYSFYSKADSVLANYFGSSTSFLIELGILLLGIWFLGRSFMLNRKVTKEKQQSWNVRLIYIPIIAILGLLVYGMYRPSSSESPFYKPPTNIEERCVMNGLGKGDCTFTNTGKSVGYVCGYIGLYKKDSSTEEGRSAVICSGNMESHSTKKIEFEVVGIDDICKSSGNGKWSDVCDFTFIKNQE